MTLDEAVRLVKERYIVLDRAAPEGAIILCSGGTTKDADAPPALCDTRELAVDLWMRALSEAADAIEEASYIRWAEEPGMYRFAITVQGPDGAHRQVAERYAVVSGAWISDDPGMELPPARAKSTGGVR